MRFSTILATTLVLAAPSAALAQADKKAPKPAANCTELLRSLDVIEATAETVIEDVANGCTVSNAYIGFGSYNRFRLGELTLQSPDLFTNYASGSLPQELELHIAGFQIAPDTGNLLNNYIFEVQAEPLDIHLAYRWDKQSGDLELADFSVTANDYGAIRLAGRVSGFNFDPDNMDDLTEIPGAFDQLVLQVENAQFFSAMLVPSMLGFLPYDEDPRPLIASYQQAAIAFVNGLPQSSISDDSKAALNTFIESFPQPRGDYTLELRADPGLPFSTLDVDDLTALLPLLANLQLAVTHAPSDQP